MITLLFHWGSNSTAVIHRVTTSRVSLPTLTPFITNTGIKGSQLHLHDSSVCQWFLAGGVEVLNHLGKKQWKPHSGNPPILPFYRWPSSARLPTSPSGWRGHAPWCCLGPRVSWRAAGDPCSAAHDTAPPWPQRQNTTPVRRKRKKIQWQPGKKCLCQWGYLEFRAVHLSAGNPSLVQKW